MPGARSRGRDAPWSFILFVRLLAATVDGLEARALRLERGLQRVEDALRLRRVVRRVVADVDVQRDESGFGPGVDREVRFSEQHGACNAVGFELEEAVADDRQPGFLDRTATDVAQCVCLRQQRFVGRASVPLPQQMDTFHGVYPPGAFHAASSGSRSDRCQNVCRMTGRGLEEPATVAV